MQQKLTAITEKLNLAGAGLWLSQRALAELKLETV
jgi:hypothetical protein